MTGHNARLAHDWYGLGIPANVVVGEDVYIDTSYSFAAYASQRTVGLVLGDASGVYDRTSFVVGPRGMVSVGAYTCLNGTSVVCEERVTIGAHCFIAWGVVITDCWPDARASAADRRAALDAASRDTARHLGAVAVARPVTIEDGVWVGFDSVVLPGVTLGRGCVIGCKTVIASDVPRYAVVVGDPPRVVRVLDADDNEHARERAIQEWARR